MKKNIGLISVFLAVLIWGATYVVTKIGLEEIGPNTIGFLRGVLGSIFLVSILAVQGKLKEFLKLFKSDYKIFIIIGGIGITGSMVTQNTALTLTSSALFSVILSSTTPIFITLISIIFLKEKFSNQKLLGLTLGFVGVLIILINKEIFNGISSKSSLVGQLLSLATSLIWAIYTILNKQFSKNKNISAIFLTTGAYIFGTIFLAPIAFIFEDPLSLVNYSLQSWGIILFLGFISAGLAFYLWNYGFTKVEASKAGIFMYFIPVISLLLGWLLLSEILTIQAIIGSIVIFMGAWIVGKK
jgi:drug/metabolite transporter (DMT)-like permease